MQQEDFNLINVKAHSVQYSTETNENALLVLPELSSQDPLTAKLHKTCNYLSLRCSY